MDKKYLVIKATKWNFQNSIQYTVVSDKANPLNKHANKTTKQNKAKPDEGRSTRRR